MRARTCKRQDDWDPHIETVLAMLILQKEVHEICKQPFDTEKRPNQKEYLRKPVFWHGLWQPQIEGNLQHFFGQPMEASSKESFEQTPKAEVHGLWGVWRSRNSAWGIVHGITLFEFIRVLL